MNLKYSKKYMVPAVLLLAVWLIQLIRQFTSGLPALNVVKYEVTYGSAFLLLACYCLFLQHRQAGKVFYFVAVGWLMMSSFVCELWPLLNSPFSLLQIHSIFFFFAVGALLAVKIKPHFAFLITGAILLMVACVAMYATGACTMPNPTFYGALGFALRFIISLMQSAALALILLFETLHGRRAKE